jgi:hypothetical protein
MDAESSNPDDFDPTQRRLCPDGACVGVIRADGRCSECGRTEAEAAAGEPPADLGARLDFEAAPDGQAAGGTGADAVGFDPTRRLCDDGACVGVVGDDGVCRACGRRSQ